MAVKHTFVSSQPQSSDPNLVSKNEWNANHTIEAETIGTTELANLAVTSGKLATDSVVTAKIEDGAVTKAKQAVLARPITLNSINVFTASGTWNKPTNLAYVVVHVIGGGGGGGGAAATGVGEGAEGGGGGGGGGSVKRILEASLGSTETVTVGASGAGGTAGNNAGAAGGTSSFGAHLSATGGGAGSGGPNTTGANSGASGSGGAGSSGDANMDGGSGIRGRVISGFASFQSSGGAGAGPHGGGLVTGVINATGTAGRPYGGGGQGGALAASQSAVAGGAGAAGVVIVYEYIYAAP